MVKCVDMINTLMKRLCSPFILKKYYSLHSLISNFHDETNEMAMENLRSKKRNIIFIYSYFLEWAALPAFLKPYQILILKFKTILAKQIPRSDSLHT